MKNTWLRYLNYVLQFFIFTTFIQITVTQECKFPESDIEPFFFDIKADLPPDSVIVDTAVDPPDAQLRLVNVRSNNLPDIDYTEKFDIEQRARGQFMVLSRSTLQLPRYPSSFNETYLYMTVLCNNQAYPLITVRIRNFNSFSPKFYNEPYEVVLPGKSTVNTLISTPLLALDSDPEVKYPITYKIESGQYSDEFALITSRTDYHPIKSLPKQFRANPNWRQEQLPPIVKLHIQQQPRDHEYRLNISATDSGTPPKKTFATLRVIIGTIKSTEFLKFTQKEYFANFSKLMTVDTEILPNTVILADITEQTPKRKRSRVMYELAESDYSDYFLLDHRTAQLTIRNKLTTDIPSTFTLTIKAFLESDMSSETTTTLTLTDISDESLTYFSKCFYEINVPENSYPDTLVTQLQIHGTPDEIILLNGTDYFRVDSKGHLLTKQPFDRELLESIILQAQLVDKDGKNYPHSNLCTTATIVVTIDDINDNSPKFEKPSYVFYIDEKPYNNTEVGTLKAFDNDKGNFGKVHYRMLADDPENIPFTLFESNNAATIYYVIKNPDASLDKMYSFPVEAYDTSVEPRSSRVTVQVILHEAPEGSDYDVSDSRASHVLPHDQSSLASLDSPDILSKLETEKIVTSTKAQQRRKQITSTQVAPVAVKKVPKTIIRPMSEIRKTSEQFEFNEYRFSVFGEIQEGTYVGTIRIANSKNDAIYELEAGIRGFFRIDSVNGHLYVDKRLLEDEYEEVRFSAYAKRNGNIVANTLITVILDDSVSIYELTPRFEQSFYRFEIEENQPPQILGNVKAHHRAIEIDNDQMIYTLNSNSNSDANSFSIDSATGELSSIEEFDREKQHLYKIQITGCLQSNSSSCDETEAVVVILDVNDNAPVFEEDLYKVTISTDIDSQTELATVKASDSDLGRNGQVRYELLLDGNGNFKINENSGELYYVGEAGDLKINRRFQLKIKATDNGVPTLNSETNVTINVGGENTNPNAPQFTNFRYEVTLPANVPADSSILTVEATDADPGPDGEITYKISDNDAARHDRIHQLFVIDPISGEILTKQPLNANTDGPIIQFVVEAHDKSPTFPRKSETVVMLRFKERNAAKLEFVPLPKTVFISSEKPVGSEIIGISAKTVVEDDSHKIRYGISVPNIADYFEVPANTGSLRVKKPLIEGRFPVTLTAYIPGTRLNATHSMMIVVMTDRDKYPVFDKLSYEMKVPISAAFPVKLEKLNATLSTGHIEYSLYQAERLPQGISVDKVTGQLTIFEEFVSAFDGAGNVFVVIRARNVDWPTFYSDAGVTLILSDTSTTLAFPAKLYRLVIVENKMQGTTLEPPIEVVNAQEIGNVEYFVEPADSLFSINARGELYLKKTVDLEELPPSSQGIVEINVVAKHNGEKATTKVQIKVEDENEFTPVFLEDQYDFEIREQPKDGQALGTIRAIDEDFTDKGRLKYQIVDRSGAASTLTNILQNGTIVKKPGARFENGIYEMIVEALDYVGHSTEIVVSFYVQIDGNERTPPPEPKEINQSWEIKNDIIGSRFAVYGLPNRRWQFSLGEGNEDGIFELREINDTMAEVEIIAEPNITATNRKLEVEVIDIDDTRKTIMTNIEINLSNAISTKVPKFVDKNDKIQLPSNFNPNAVIFTVKASQNEGNNKIQYEILGDENNNFEINRTSGEVTFAQNDRPKLPGKYELTIKATAPDAQSGTAYSTEKIYTVEILPLSDSHSVSSTVATVVEPEITSIEHQEEIKSTITDIEDITTTDNEPKTTTENEPEVDKTSTFIPTEIDTVATEPEELPTSVVVSSLPTETTPEEMPTESVTEELTEPTPTNSIVPLTFEQPGYSFMVENQRRGSKVGEIQLTGAHLGSNLQMEITPSEMAEIFRVDLETNEIFLKKVPESSQESQEYVFNVTVFDAENPERRAQTEISVSMMPFVVNPSEATNEETMFPSSSTSAEQSSAIPSTLETTSESEIPDIEAPSAKPIATSTGISTTDSLLDIRFDSTQFTATLPEGRYSNGIISLKPAPLNKGMPSGVVYSIDFSTTMKNETFPFSIREDNGIINVFGEIDREFNDLYEFIVTATLKQGEQEISDSALVQVRIDDVNDNAPEFINAPHVVALSTDTRVGSVIASFNVTDNDEGAFGTISLSLDGELKDYFAIDNNGILTLSKELSPSLGDKINIIIVATDGGRPALKNVHMLTIELYSEAVQKPGFKEAEYTATVSPNASRGQFVAQVVAGIDKLNYAFDNSYSDLFMVNNKGVITLGRNPLKNERNKQYSLNLTATDGNKAVSKTIVNIFLEGQNISQLPTSAITPIKGDPTCEFKSKVYNTEIRENTPERRLLAKVEADCKFLSEDTKVLYIIHQGSKEFEMNETTGELFVNAPLDRENRTLHFVVVNLTLITPEQSDSLNARNRRKTDAIIEYARSKLSNNQALIVVKVLDENDNSPVFSRTNSNNEYVFPVDWQLPLKPIGRIQATDADENKNVTYVFSEASEYFSINATSGVVNLVKSLEHADQEVYDMEVQAFDGKNTVTTRVKIYPLMPGVNIIVLTAKNPVEEINELAVSRELTQALEMDTRVLVKRIFVNEDNTINREKSHLLIYALRKETHEPVPASELKEKLEKLLPQLQSSKNLNIETISLPIVSSKFQMTNGEIMLFAAAGILFLATCIASVLCCRFCKRRTKLEKSEGEYMVDAESNGPRPYNVELISRRTAQNVLAGRELPNPFEEVKLSSQSRASLLTSSGMIFNDGQLDRSLPSIFSVSQHDTADSRSTGHHQPQNSS